MQYNDIEEITKSKEIRCQDCGHSYLVRAQAISSSCSQCGNLAYHPLDAKLELDIVESPAFEDEDSEFLGDVEPIPAQLHSPAKNFDGVANLGETDIDVGYGNVAHKIPAIDPGGRIPAENRMVDAILLQNQQEWQLWSQLIQHFNDENNHQAYLTFISNNSLWSKAIERYSAHRKTFLPIADEKWQAEIADQKLEELSAICQVQMERIVQEPVRRSIADWLLQTTESGTRLRTGFSLLFLAIGLFLGAAVTISLAM